MEIVKWIDVAISILSGIAVCIPLVLKLVSCVKQVVAEKIEVTETNEVSKDEEMLLVLKEIRDSLKSSKPKKSTKK